MPTINALDLPRWIVWTTVGLILGTAVAGWLTLAIVLYAANGIEDRHAERLERISDSQDAIIAELRAPTADNGVPERAEMFRSVIRTEAMIERLCAVSAGCELDDFLASPHDG